MGSCSARRCRESVYQVQQRRRLEQPWDCISSRPVWFNSVSGRIRLRCTHGSVDFVPVVFQSCANVSFPAEEIKDASVTLPRSVVSGVIINGIMGFIMVITICFTLGDIQSLLTTPTKYPFIQLFFNTTKSYAATNAMTSMIIIVFTSAVISEIATSSRQLWSFARDGGFPFSPFIAKVRPTLLNPLHMIVDVLFRSITG